MGSHREVTGFWGRREWALYEIYLPLGVPSREAYHHVELAEVPFIAREVFVTSTAADRPGTTDAVETAVVARAATALAGGRENAETARGELSVLHAD